MASILLSKCNIRSKKRKEKTLHYVDSLAGNQWAATNGAHHDDK